MKRIFSFMVSETQKLSARDIERFKGGGVLVTSAVVCSTVVTGAAVASFGIYFAMKYTMKLLSDK